MCADGVSPNQHAAVERLKLPGVIPGPNQVRIDRVTAGEHWTQIVMRALRAMAVRDEHAGG
jgi:hypothetical protein